MSDLGQSDLRPTLWRTCRAVANRPRLKILQFLVRHPRQHVSAIASRLGMQVPIASEYLRMLEARGILECRRTGKWVHYSLSTGTSPHAAPVVAALAKTFETRQNPAGYIFGVVTAFTHPRRVAIVAILARRQMERAELRRETGTSDAALSRHLRKLRERGFVNSSGNNWSLAIQDSPLPQALLKLALLK